MKPVRTCVACRARADRNELVRIVEQDGTLIIDERSSLPGRGAWVHNTNACMTLALRRRVFGRALRVSGTLDTQTIQNHLQRNG